MFGRYRLSRNCSREQHSTLWCATVSINKIKHCIKYLTKRTYYDREIHIIRTIPLMVGLLLCCMYQSSETIKARSIIIKTSQQEMYVHTSTKLVLNIKSKLQSWILTNGKVWCVLEHFLPGRINILLYNFTLITLPMLLLSIYCSIKKL